VAATQTTQTKQDRRKIFALSGIPNRDPSKRAASKLRLRPHGHRNYLKYATENSGESRATLYGSLST